MVADAAGRDQRLVTETGRTFAEMGEEYRALSADERTALLVDGYRWRHHWHPDQVAHRKQLEERHRRRLAIESSHDISRMIGHIGPSYRELHRRRSVPAWTVYCAGRGCPQLLTLDTRPTGTECCHRCTEQRGEAAA